MKMPQLRTIFAVAGVAMCTAAQASTFSVTSSDNRFIVTRAGEGVDAAETVRYRTVGLSAYAGQHFTEKSGTLMFAAGQTAVTNFVTEKTPTIDAYKFQTTTQRSYRFELTDEGGFPITNAVRSITTGTQLSTTYLNREVTDLVYFTSGGSITSGSGNKYLDVTYGPSSYRQVTDGGYNQAVHTVGTGSLYGNNAELRTFLDGIGCKMYATVYFTQKEEQDGYQYIQILADNATTYDGNDPNGAVDTPSTSIYKACFILSYTPSGSVMEDDHYQFFPHRYDYVDKAAETSAGISHYEFDYNNSHLYEQKFRNNTPSYRTSTSGSLVLATSVNNLNIRFDAAGSGGDTWDFKNLKVRLALVDTASPVMLTASAAAAPGVHAKGNDLYVSVAFNEPVTCSSASLTTTWGMLSHNSGSGSNVLTFKGKISASASGNLNITSWSGTIKDLAGNELAGSSALNQSNLATLTGSHSYSISYDLAGGALPGGSASNPTSYTYESDGITLANPVRTGYNFVGWTGTGFSGLTNAVTIAAHSHGDRAYTAHWAPITYTVHFDANGGTGTMPDQCFTYDEPQALASNAFTRASFAFGGWRRAVGGATTYADGATVANLAAQQDDVVTLDAVWTPTPTWTGDGSSDSPYLITTREQLADLAAYANGGFDPYDDACYKLMADIAYDPAATNSYTPIYNGGFVFDGNGHTISGIRISRPDEDEQGLFGLFDGGVVKNLTLADSVIEGNDDIGGIVGRFYGGVIQNCFVIGTTISDYGGAVVGYIPTRGEGTLSNCAYHDCPPARGIGNENDRSGEVEKVFALSFGDGVEPIVPPQYAFPVYGETNSYYAAGQNVIVRVDEGAFVLVNGTEEGVTDLGNGEFLFLASADVAVTHAVTYIDASGIEQQCTNFTVLASAAGDATYGTSGAESWYVVTTNVTIGGRLLFNDSSVHLILCDGASLAVTNTSGTAISADDLTIYGQTDGTGTLAANGSDYGIYANDNLTINGGAVNATGYHGIYAIYDITINGGTVSATGVIYGICALYDLTINGGTVSATDGIYGIYARYDLTLGWTDPTDSIAASSYYSYNGTISVKAGQLLTDGTTIYQGAVDRAVLAGKTLRPYLVPYIDANGDAQVCTNYTVITSSDGNATYGDLDAEHWYVVTTNVTVSGLLCFNGDAHLILCDGATLTVTNSGVAIAAQSLIIYGQAGGTGALVATAVAAGICANYDVTINGGNVAATGSSYGIFADRGSVTINGGNVAATGSSYGIFASFDIILGWTNPDDSIYANSYYSSSDNVTINGILIDGGNAYSGSTSTSDIAGKTLTPPMPAISYIDEDGYERQCYAYTVLTNAAADVEYGESDAENWYVVTNNVMVDGRLHFDDRTAHLILCDGATLAVTNENGNAIETPGNLNIYGQANGTGAIVATGDLGIDGHSVTINSGSITATGGDEGGDYGICADVSVTINGGAITATGKSSGINGYNTMTINGGSVTATGKSSGIYGNKSVTINGGSVTATATDDGIYVSNGSATINGGSITATGGRYGIDAGDSVTITGGSVTATATRENSDGIHAGDSVTINGGSVTATGDYGIYANDSSVTINGGSVTATATDEYGTGIYARSKIILGWTNPADSITASSYLAAGSSIYVKSGQTLTDGVNTYSTGTPPRGLDPDDIAGKTLIPAIPYVDANGGSQYCTSFTILTNAAGDVGFGESGAENWYVVTNDVSIVGMLQFNGATNHLIVCNRAALTVTNMSGDAIFTGGNLAIYGQSGGTGTLTAYGDGYGIYAEEGVTTNGVGIAASGVHGDAIAYLLTGLTVDGRDVGFLSGPGWHSDRAHTVYLTNAGPFTVSGSTTAGLGIEAATNAQVTLSDVLIDSSAYEDRIAFRVAPGAHVDFTLEGNNTFKTADGDSASAKGRAALEVPEGASVTIDGEGSLTATAGTSNGQSGGAGIGGGYDQNAGTIEIRGGTITALSRNSGAGIGGGTGGNGGTTTISGGIVSAQGRHSGIGGGYQGHGGAITISGGTVYARGTVSGRPDIGGMVNSDATSCIITGGSVHADHGILKPAATNANHVAVHCVTIAGLPADTEQQITWLTTVDSGYGQHDMRTDSNGNLYVWLPDGEHYFSVAGVGFHATVDDADVRAEPWSGIMVPYVDANGDVQQCFDPAVITNAAGNVEYGEYGPEKWYVVTNDVTISGSLSFNDGTVHLILCDGATLTVTNENGSAIFADDLAIYCQTNATGALVANGSGDGIAAGTSVTINGGNVSATGGDCGIGGDNVTINGGSVTATAADEYGTGIVAGRGSIILGWTNPTDSIYASSYYGHVRVKSGKLLTDGSNTYSADDSPLDPNDIAGKTLIPYFTPWQLLQARLDVGGTVTLTNDVTAADGDASLTVTNAVTLNLNGHTITHNGNGQVLNVVTGGDLTLTNSLAAGSVTGGGDHGVYVGRNAVFRLQGGAIAGNESSYAGGGVFVDRFGTFAMSGGSITNNAVWGGRYSGGGVYVYYGTFTMTGGAISGNTAYYGGGVEVDDGGSFEMSGGAISGNTAYCGGGVDVYYGTFTMTGGAISGNKARDGGGVYVYGGTFAISGSPVISGSTNSVGAANNVYLYSGRTIAVDGLSDGARIGVTTETAPTESSPVTFATGAAEGDETYFTSDNPGFAVYGEDGSLRLRLVVTYTVRFDANGGAGAMPDQTFIYDAQQALASNAFTRTGYTFAGWRGGDGSIYPDGATVSNLTVRHASLPADAWKLFDRMPYPGKSNDDYTPSFGDLQNKDGDNGLNLYTGFENVAWNPEDPDTVAILSANAFWFDEHDARNGVSMKLIEDFPNFYFPGFYIEQVDDAQGAAVTLTAIWQPHVPVPYIDADGNEQMCTIYNVLTNANGDVAYGELGAENWYVVTNDVTISGRLFFGDYHAHLIVCDGATLTVSNENGNAIDAYGLAIHCQTNATGALVANGSDSGIDGDSVTINGGSVTATGVNGVCAYSVTINGGNVNATGGTYGIYPLYDLTINGGNVNATGGTYGIDACRGDITINGGNVSAIGGEDGDGIYASGNGTIILGWTNPTNSITASSYFGYVCVKSGQVLTDGSNIYGSHLGTSPSALAGKTLRPAYSISLPEGVVADGVVTQDGTTAYALPGATVTLRAAAPGYAIGNVTVNGDALEPVGGVYSFAASAASITVTAATVMTQWQALQTQLDAGGAVTLANDVTAMSIDSPLTVTNAVTLDLNGHVIDADGWFRVIEVLEGGNLTLTNSVEGAGAVIGGCDVYYGGGVYVNEGGAFTMAGGTISENAVTGGTYGGDAPRGGGVYVDGGTFTMTGGTICSNKVSKTAGYGGGVYVVDGAFTMNGGIIIDNDACQGGGVYMDDVAFEMTGGSISNNYAAKHGGGVCANKCTVTISCGEISGNVVGPSSGTIGGGGVYVYSSSNSDRSTFTMTGGEISGNVVYASGSTDVYGGGGVYVNEYGTFAMTGGSIISNSVQSSGRAYGGGVCLKNNSGTGTMTGGTISGNFVDTAGDGGSIYAAGGGMFVNKCAFTMSGGEISGNWSSKNGGGVAVGGIGYAFVMTGGEISGNTAKCLGIQNIFGGGGVYVNNNATFAMTNSVVSGNVASKGGGVFVNNGTFKVSGVSVVSGNTNSVGAAANVYLPSGKEIAVDGLSADASIGVTTAVRPTESLPLTFATGAVEGDETYFFSDNPAYHAEYANGEVSLVYGMVYPAYLYGAKVNVTNNWVGWAEKYGANTNAACEGHFLLGISPATTIPEGGALLKVVQFNATARSFHIEIGSDVPGYRFFQPKDADGEDDPTLLGNGYAVLELAMDLPAFAPNQTIPQIVRMPVPVAIDATTGHATVDFDLGEFLAQLYPEVPQEWRDEVTMPSPLFLRPAISTTYPDDYTDFLYLLVAEP